MWELDYEESWTPKNWCFWTVMQEKTLESPLDCKVIQPVHPNGDQSWVFIGRTHVEAETPILWPPDAKSWLIRKDPDAGKDWWQEEMGMTEYEMVGWHHWLDEHGFGWTPGVGDGQGGLALQRVGQDWEAQLFCRRMSSLLLHWPLHVVCTSQSAYSWSSPIILGRCLDMLRALWVLLRLRSVLSQLVLACKVHNYPHSPHSRVNCGDLICWTYGFKC